MTAPSKRFTILVVNESFTDLLNGVGLLKKQFPTVEIIYSNSSDDGIDMALTFNPELILIDHLCSNIEHYQQLTSNTNTNLIVTSNSANNADNKNIVYFNDYINNTLLIESNKTNMILRQTIESTSEHKRLSALVAERTRELNNTHIATLNILEDLKMEIEMRKKTEEALRDSEARLRRAEIASRSGNWELDLSTYQMILSEGAQALTGIGKSEFDHNLIRNLLLPEYIEVIESVLHVLIEKEIPYEIDLKLKQLHTDNIIYVHLLALYDKDKNVLYGVMTDITEKTEAKNALRESEELYRTIIQTSPDIIIVIDTNDNFKIISPSSISKYGYQSEKDLIGRNFKEFIHPDEVGKAERNIKSQLSGEDIGPQEYRIKKADNSYIDAEINADFIRDEKGNPLLLVLVVRDISERKHIQQKLQQSEESYRMLVENLPLGIGVYRDDKFTYINQTGLKLFETENIDDFVGRPVLSVVHPDSIEKVRDRVKLVTNGYHVPPMEEKLLRKDGSMFYAEVTALGTFIEGESAGLVLVSDITDRRMVQDALIESEERYNIFINNNEDKIYVKDEDCRYLIANKSLAGFMNIEAENMLNFTDEELNRDPEYSRIMALSDNTVLNTDQLLVFEEHISDKHFEITKFPMSLTGNRKGIGCILHDITKRKQAEQKLSYVSRLYSLLSHINQAIVHHKNEFDLYSEVCRHVIEQGQFSMCWIGVYNEENLCIEPVASNGIGCDYLNDVFVMPFAELPYNMTPSCIVFREKNSYYCNDVSTDENMKPFARHALSRNFNSMFSTPIIKKGKSYGVLSMYLNEKDNLGEEEQKLLQEIGMDISFAIDAIDSDMERKEAEKALATSEAKYRDLIEHSPDAIVIYQEGCVVYVNQETTRLMHAKTKDDLLGKNIIEFIHPDYRQNALKKLALVSDNKQHKTSPMAEEVYIRLDGKPISVEVKAMPIQLDGMPAIQINARDITVRKQIEEALQKNEALLRSLIDNSPFLIWGRDLNGVGILENRKMVEKYGPFVGTKLGDNINTPKEVIVKLERINKRVLGGEIVISEYETLEQNKMINYQQIVFPIRDNDEIIGIAGFNINITDKKESEKALLQSREDLARFAAHLQNVREEERSHLAREIHDDLGQILVAMKIDIGLLKNKVVKTVLPDAQNELNINFGKIQQLVDNTLTSARRIMTDLRPEVLDLLGLTETIIQHLKSFEMRNNIQCTFENNTSGANLNSQQSVALYRIVQEALNNIAKHSKATHVRIILEQQHNIISLQIIDNGIGFDTSDKRRTDSYGLMGINERAVLLNGTLSIISSPGKGTNIGVKFELKK